MCIRDSLQAPVETWNELFTKQIIRFIDERGYNSNFVKRIMKDDYKKVISLINKIGEEVIKNKTNCEPEKKANVNLPSSTKRDPEGSLTLAIT